jgi:chorismate mutase/prephenate dehydratase
MSHDGSENNDAIALLARCREGIDAIDRRLVELLNERTGIVEEIGRVKREAKLAIYEPKRESQVFDNITLHNRGPLGADGLKRIFERIIDEMRRVQKDRMAAGTHETSSNQESNQAGLNQASSNQASSNQASSNQARTGKD